jgi:hypothetical protein
MMDAQFVWRSYSYRQSVTMGIAKGTVEKQRLKDGHFKCLDE